MFSFDKCFLKAGELDINHISAQKVLQSAPIKSGEDPETQSSMLSCRITEKVHSSLRVLRVCMFYDFKLAL